MPNAPEIGPIIFLIANGEVSKSIMKTTAQDTTEKKCLVPLQATVSSVHRSIIGVYLPPHTASRRVTACRLDVGPVADQDEDFMQGIES